MGRERGGRREWDNIEQKYQTENIISTISVEEGDGGRMRRERYKRTWSMRKILHNPISRKKYIPDSRLLVV